MKSLVETDICRMRQICEYFGETPKAWDKCGDCDVCAGLPEWLQKDEAKPARRMIYESDVPEGKLAALKTWRRDFARKQRVAPYVILHDRTLTELLLRRPVTVQDLLEVPGIGPQKARKYGEEILEALFQAEES
jgi:ATP-dependent DNA helicase RecQ